MCIRDRYNWDTHKEQVGQNYANADVCHSRLCDSDCIDLLSGDDLDAFDAICYFSEELFTREVCTPVLGE